MRWHEVFWNFNIVGNSQQLRLEASNAVASCVDEAKEYIQNAQVVEQMKPALSRKQH
ncbi:MAG: hypothetical protein PT116_24720 [Aphanizomenon gracile PMC638.10]|nr:hypothetical protein [Aphanizomenon gracile PMC638.10]